MTVDDRHDLGAFAAARWTDRSAPFFAEAKVASTKASLRSILPLLKSPMAIGTAARSKERFEDGPLLVGQVHAVEYDSDRNAVSGGVPIYAVAS